MTTERKRRPFTPGFQKDKAYKVLTGNVWIRQQSNHGAQAPPARDLPRLPAQAVGDQADGKIQPANHDPRCRHGQAATQGRHLQFPGTGKNRHRALPLRQPHGRGATRRALEPGGEKWTPTIGQHDKCILGSSRHPGSSHAVTGPSDTPHRTSRCATGAPQTHYRPTLPCHPC